MKKKKRCWLKQDKVASNENQISKTDISLRATKYHERDPLSCHINICNFKSCRFAYFFITYWSRLIFFLKTMAASASPMASQLRSSLSSAAIARRLAVPKGISGPSFGVYPTKRISSFTVRAAQTDKVFILKLTIGQDADQIMCQIYKLLMQISIPIINHAVWYLEKI